MQWIGRGASAHRRLETVERYAITTTTTQGLAVKGETGRQRIADDDTADVAYHKEEKDSIIERSTWLAAL